jgi:hypothetical protein
MHSDAVYGGGYDRFEDHTPYDGCNLIPDRSCWALVLLLYFGYFLTKRERAVAFTNAHKYGLKGTAS